MNIKKLSLLLFLLSFFTATSAQQWQVGIGGGAAGYMGDLNLSNPLKFSGVHANFFVKRNLDTYFGAALNYNYGHVRAADAHSSNSYFQERNLSFRSALHELSLNVEFNFYEYIFGAGQKRFYSPYVFVGGGIVAFKPKANYNGNTYHLADYTTEGQSSPYKQYAWTIPYGVGVRFNVDENFNVFSQIGYRNPLTDYIDDVSGRYPDPAVTPLSPVSLALSDRSGEFSGNYTGRPGVQRGDFRKRDTYMFVGIGISYTFVSSKCFY